MSIDTALDLLREIAVALGEAVLDVGDLTDDQARRLADAFGERCAERLCGLDSCP